MLALDYDELARALIRQGLPEAVAAAIVPVSPSPSAKLLSRVEVAQALGVSPGCVDLRVKEGMPRTMVGDLPRFDLALCRAWLEEQATKQKSEAPTVRSTNDGWAPRVTPSKPRKS